MSRRLYPSSLTEVGVDSGYTTEEGLSVPVIVQCGDKCPGSGLGDVEEKLLHERVVAQSRFMSDTTPPSIRFMSAPTEEPSPEEVDPREPGE